MRRITDSNVLTQDDYSEDRFNQKKFIIIELIILLIVTVIITSTIIFFIFAWISLYLRKMGWKEIGFKKPENWTKAVLFDLLVSVLIVISLLVAVLPALKILTGSMLDLSAFNALKEGNLFDRILALLGWIILTWTLAAFGEELVYRGYIQNRLVDLTGDNRNGWIIAILITSIFFGINHAYQGIVGVITTSLIAIIYSVTYLKFERNLYAAILLHGMYDTLAFLALFFFGEFLRLL